MAKVMQRLEKKARVERERKIPLAGVTGEVIHEESSLLRGESNRRRETEGVKEVREMDRQCR